MGIKRGIDNVNFRDIPQNPTAHIEYPFHNSTPVTVASEHGANISNFEREIGESMHAETCVRTSSEDNGRGVLFHLRSEHNYTWLSFAYSTTIPTCECDSMEPGYDGSHRPTDSGRRDSARD